jgi:hypothetical protein
MPSQLLLLKKHKNRLVQKLNHGPAASSTTQTSSTRTIAAVAGRRPCGMTEQPTSLLPNMAPILYVITHKDFTQLLIVESG